MTRRRPTSRTMNRTPGSPAVVHDMLAVATPGLGSDPESVTAWMAEGSCRVYPPNKFFPSDGAGVDRARKICATCPVAQQCLEYALEHRIEHGVWGGCSERERRRILKRRRVEISND
jgi:WhiB family transcriptional regulator, redox-sensing transcriptional regulator